MHLTIPTFSVFLLLLCGVCTVHAQTKHTICGDGVCPGDYQCCVSNGQPVCYNPSTHFCYHNNLICSNKEIGCGKSCVDPSKYFCEDNVPWLRKDVVDDEAMHESATKMRSPITTLTTTVGDIPIQLRSFPATTKSTRTNDETPRSETTASPSPSDVESPVVEDQQPYTPYIEAYYEEATEEVTRTSEPFRNTTTSTTVVNHDVEEEEAESRRQMWHQKWRTVSTARALQSGQTRFDAVPFSTEATPYLPRDHTLSPSDWWSGDLKGKPLPTNAWWQNIVIGSGSNTIYTMPFMYRAHDFGFAICYPERIVNPTWIAKNFYHNIGFSSVEPKRTRSVIGFDDLSVTVKWFAEGGQDQFFTVPCVRGNTYATATYNRMRPVITTDHTILYFNGLDVIHSTVGPQTGRRFKITLDNQQTWLIYTSTDITFELWTFTQSTPTTGPIIFLRAVNNGWSGTVRMAYMRQADHEALLDQHSNAYPIGGVVTYLIQGDQAVIQYNWRKQLMVGDGPSTLMMQAAPHQVDMLDTNANRLWTNMYQSMKGWMVPIVADSWKLNQELSSIAWSAPRQIADPSQRVAVLSALRADAQEGSIATTISVTNETYFFGKEVARIARLALIADDFGEDGIANNLRNLVKSKLSAWITGNTPNPLRYDRTWKGVCSSIGMDDVRSEFGQGWYNDHHFHYGYFIYAAAAIGKRDPVWISQFRPFIVSLIRDIANPSAADPYFPVMRYKDWWAMHSWASGLFEMVDGRNQESTSESANAYYAIQLFGEATGDIYMRDFGRLMLATEIRSAKKYWQMRNPDSPQLYESMFAAGKIVGVLWSTKVARTTWFGNNVEYIHGIQYMPFLPYTETLLMYNWLVEDYPVLMQGLAAAGTEVEQEWKGYLYMAHAIIDKYVAWAEINSLQYFDNGNSKTNALYWVATRP